jgi:hypothetical protein
MAVRGNRLHLRLEHARLLVAQLRFFLQRAQDHFIEPHVNVNFLRGRLDLLARQFAGQHLVEHHAQRVNVRPMIHLARRFDLLRRHVLRRAQTLPASVRTGDPSPGFATLSPSNGERDGVRGSLPPTIFARPKSATFTRPRRSSRMFSGLMSRWTMPWSCANWSASQICGTMASASRAERAARVQKLPQVHAIHNSIRKKYNPSARPKSWMVTMPG